MSSPLQPRDDVLKIMVLGDSISEGREGDWTWRYRLWQWFRDERISVDFIGPFNGTRTEHREDVPDPNYDPKSLPFNLGFGDPPTFDGGYAFGIDPAFDRDHFALWGRQINQNVHIAYDIVAQYLPDLLLIELGFNDVAWLTDAEVTISSMTTLIERARIAKPDIKFAIADVPDRLLSDHEDLVVRTVVYNAALPSVLAKSSNDFSPIKLVKLNENYSCSPTDCKAGYDGLHPNALGEYQIAEAFSQTLFKDFGLGTKPLVIPATIPVRPVSTPTNPRGYAGDMGISFMWDHFYGAIGNEIRVRRQGDPKWGQSVIMTDRWDETFVPDGRVLEFQVRMWNGDAEVSDWTPIVSVASRAKSVMKGPIQITEHKKTGSAVLFVFCCILLALLWRRRGFR